MPAFPPVVRGLVAALLLIPAAAGAQSRHEVSLFAEAVAGGLQYSHGVGGSLRLGAAVGFGPSEGLDITALPGRDVDPWATGYLNLALRSRGGIEVALSPIGAIVVIGDDFGVVYPSGQAQLSTAVGRFRLGTIIRTIRVAGANDRAEWWTQWIPIRLAFTL